MVDSILGRLKLSNFTTGNTLENHLRETGNSSLIREGIESKEGGLDRIKFLINELVNSDPVLDDEVRFNKFLSKTYSGLLTVRVSILKELVISRVQQELS